MSMYAHRTCDCGRSFTTDCNEYTCSAECEDRAVNQHEHEDFEDSPGNLSEALAKARAGELNWYEIQSYARRARRAAQASNSLADAFSAELKWLQANDKVPAGADMWFP
jgi:hypothetical protein